MTRRNISHTHRVLERHDATDQVYIDGDSSEAIFRALVDGDHMDEFEAHVEAECPVSVQHVEYVGIGLEVTLR